MYIVYVTWLNLIGWKCLVVRAMWLITWTWFGEWWSFHAIRALALGSMHFSTKFPLSKNQPTINYCTKINPNQTNQPTKIIRKSTLTKESTHESPICEHFKALVVVMSSMSTQRINPLRTSITTKRERERGGGREWIKNDFVLLVAMNSTLNKSIEVFFIFFWVD